VADGFSLDAPGVPSGLFIQSYGHGYVESTRIIIHEGGHAIHGQLMNEAGASPLYEEGPSWLFEAYATLNEFLMYDYLAAQAKDPAMRAYYLEAGLDNMAFQLFGSAEEASLEEAIYDGTIAGKINNAADLDNTALAIWNNYEIWPAVDPELKHVWATKRLMVQDPLYLVNYLYSGLIAANMLDTLHNDPKGFPQKYNKLLREGFDADPQVLLDNFFGTKISQQQMVERAAGIFAGRVAELERAYGDMEREGYAKP
jgi:oligoendopeptidase F